MQKKLKIGVFDSGVGGLTVFKEIVAKLPDYDYLYLGDNARAPYGDHSFDVIYKYTLECVEWMFKQGCELIILACNTASAKALRNIQQKDLVDRYPHKRVLGVIRPTAETIGNYSKTGNIAVLGTRGTIESGSYLLEINHFFPNLKVHQQSCPLWVPLIENKEHLSEGAAYFVEKDLKKLAIQSNSIDVILLGCTHYPLMIPTIKKFVSPDVKIISQGEIVANSLVDYLNRHPELERELSKNSTVRFCTTGSELDFKNHASLFFDKEINTEKVTVG
ncbi:glutamate racemase [Pedobacter flavus]|uniref:Glutamate racemase n=1 Tax=Pedobacter flavus TaxID=3113906 RepID=A0ABU7H1R8_9SPHI|nr:glutamate racemase [Pedobacter sp. VNH31]MEE1885194.1 glutamate racemase [Pedobacter sp. VNH31]